ncbi:hypothetical protein GVAV_000239 [Gurleya vavrai]
MITFSNLNRNETCDGFSENAESKISKIISEDIKNPEYVGQSIKFIADLSYALYPSDVEIFMQSNKKIIDKISYIDFLEDKFLIEKSKENKCQNSNSKNFNTEHDRLTYNGFAPDNNFDVEFLYSLNEKEQIKFINSPKCLDLAHELKNIELINLGTEAEPEFYMGIFDISQNKAMDKYIVKDKNILEILNFSIKFSGKLPTVLNFVFFNMYADQYGPYLCYVQQIYIRNKYVLIVLKDGKGFFMLNLKNNSNSPNPLLKTVTDLPEELTECYSSNQDNELKKICCKNYVFNKFYALKFKNVFIIKEIEKLFKNCLEKGEINDISKSLKLKFKPKSGYSQRI